VSTGIKMNTAENENEGPHPGGPGLARAFAHPVPGTAAISPVTPPAAPARKDDVTGTAYTAVPHPEGGISRPSLARMARDALRTYLFLLPVVAIPVAGMVAYVTAVQFAAGYAVGKHFPRKEFLFGCAVGLVFSLLVCAILLTIFYLFAAVVFFAFTEGMIILILIISCTVFAGAGCYASSGRHPSAA